MMKKIALLLWCLPLSFYAQDDLLSELEGEVEEDVPQEVIASFKSTYLINAQTNETMKKRQLDFRITHRFGNLFDGDAAHTLLGMDQATNIRFSLDYGITDDLQIGFGRSKMNEHIDGSIKYKLLKQKEKGMPLSLVLYANMAVTPKKDINNQFETLTDRFSYAYQGIIVRKFNSWLSIGILPTYLHRNRITENVNSKNGAKETNDLFSMGVMGRIKITKRMAIIAEYFYTFSDYRNDNPDFAYYQPLSIGFEIETGGHVFHVNYSNGPGIIYNDLIPYTQESWTAGQVKLGFNISRVFAL